MARNGAALAIFAVFAEARTKENGTYESQHTTHGVYDGRTCKVMEGGTHRGHHKRVGCIIAKPSATPCPVTLYRIDD